MSILVDTGAWYAVTDTADRHHQEAGRFFLDQATKTTLVRNLTLNVSLEDWLDSAPMGPTDG